jgi:CDP-glucose 4,6-dehydratase
MVIFESDFWQNRSVLITGHTGFKGSWLTLWLNELGANVHGYALDPPTTPNIFEVANIDSCLSTDIRADVLDIERLESIFQQTKPEVVFHLAAQSLVRKSYDLPVDTFATNIMGTVNILETARQCKTLKSIVIVTTDKVYENLENENPYSENDSLGGHDPYSASKAAAEIVTASYRKSFFSKSSQSHLNVATVRSGNVIGGGDWSPDRLVPDCLRAFTENKPVELRYPESIRPWQHVLEPLSGYIDLAVKLTGKDGRSFAKAWNFAPEVEQQKNVEEVAKILAQLWRDNAQVNVSRTTQNPHEAKSLLLNSSLARKELSWKQHWPLKKMLEATVEWHRAWLNSEDMQLIIRQQIKDYINVNDLRC